MRSFRGVKQLFHWILKYFTHFSKFILNFPGFFLLRNFYNSNKSKLSIIIAVYFLHLFSILSFLYYFNYILFYYKCLGTGNHSSTNICIFFSFQSNSLELRTKWRAPFYGNSTTLSEIRLVLSIF